MGEDNLGGRPVNISKAINLQECLNTCGTIDLGFSGPRFTWANQQPLSTLIQERIERFFINSDWNVLYPEAHVTHPERSHSDHSPVILSLHTDQEVRFPRPFRYQPMWLSHSDFPDLVRDAWFGIPYLPNAICAFTTKAKIWNRDQFGNIFHRKQRTCARLRGVQIALGNNPNNFLIDLEKSLLAELTTLADLETKYWSLKSRITWVVEGDRNTTFFHNSALIC
ncbi:hypothetical protein SO802_028564 [Lithocarpus litseifolius]|uniref:Reverse transcriptase n=1 Tax=Lithocarpus litseifolius TaxID=425828 RepID=A0AAW2BQM8_9ROSI